MSTDNSTATAPAVLVIPINTAIIVMGVIAGVFSMLTVVLTILTCWCLCSKRFKKSAINPTITNPITEPGKPEGEQREEEPIHLNELPNTAASSTSHIFIATSHDIISNHPPQKKQAWAEGKTGVAPSPHLMKHAILPPIINQHPATRDSGHGHDNNRTILPSEISVLHSTSESIHRGSPSLSESALKRRRGPARTESTKMLISDGDDEDSGAASADSDSRTSPTENQLVIENSGALEEDILSLEILHSNIKEMISKL